MSTSPIFTANLSTPDRYALRGFLSEAAAAVSQIEKATGTMMTYGHRNKVASLVSFGHDVLSTLFFFPFQSRKIIQFLNKDDEGEFLIRAAEVSAINTFFYRLQTAAAVPMDRVIRGKVYPANWTRRTNIPSLIQTIQNEEPIPELQQEIYLIGVAVKKLHDASVAAAGILDPYSKELAQQKEQWIESAEEGQAYKANRGQRIADIISPRAHHSID